MSLVVVTYTAVAAGNLLLRAAGQPELPGYLDVGIGVLDRVVARVKDSHENRQREHAITAMLSSVDFAGADEGDAKAADLAVARVLATVPDGEALIAAVRDPATLRALVEKKAAEEEAQLLSAAARAVFRAILDATVNYAARTALDSPDLSKLAHRQELRDLADLAGELRTLRERLEQIPAETVRLLAGDWVLTLHPVVRPGRRIEPSRLLAPTSGVFPFLDRGGLLEDLVAWADDPAAFGIQILGGAGGSGKSRLAVELCRAVLNRGEFWKAGFLGSDDLTVACAALRAMPGGRLIVMDYAETRTHDIVKVLGSLFSSATALEPVRIVLLVRNPSGMPESMQDTEPWVRAVQAPKEEATNQLLDEANCVLLDAPHFWGMEKETLFTEAIARLPDYLGLPDDTNASTTDTGFLNHAEFAQPLFVVMAAYLHLTGSLDTESGPAGLFEGVLEHEAEYWCSTAVLPKIQLDLPEPQLRLLVAFSTLTDAANDSEAWDLLSRVGFLAGEANALRREQAHAWLRQLYPGQGISRWGPLLPDRLGEYLVAEQLTGRPELIAAALDPGRSPTLWVRPFTVLARACTNNQNLTTITVAVINENLVSWCRQCHDLASRGDTWSSVVATIEALTNLIEVVGSYCDAEHLLDASRLLGWGNRLIAPLALAVAHATIQATQGDSAGPIHAEALNTYAISLAEVGQREEALGPAREALDLYRVLAEANPAAYNPDLAMSLNNYANRLAGFGKRAEALGPALEAVNLRRGLAEANPAAYTPDLAMSLNNYANRLAGFGKRAEALGPALEAVNLRRMLAEANPAAYAAQLVRSLETLAWLREETGSPDEAAALRAEAESWRPGHSDR